MWVAEKICESVGKSMVLFGEKSAKGAQRITLCPNVITPDTIPDFFIPPQIQPIQKAKPSDQARAAPSIRVSPCEGGSPKPWEAPCGPPRPHIIQVESVEEGPDDEDAGSDGEETTNADPRSQAALSLPHVARAQTCYGFCTLLESPHTRRKESLFHVEPGSLPLLLPRSRSNTYTQRTSPRPSPSTSPSSYSLNALAVRLSPRSYTLSRQSTLDSDTTSSNESSPFGSPLLGRCPGAAGKPSIFKTLSQERLLTQNQRRGLPSRNNSLSTDEGSSTDNSPNVMRRLSEETTEGLSSGYRLAPPAFFPSDLTLSRERAMRESTVPLGNNGSLRISAEYSADNQRLRLRLISAEGLYAASSDTKGINCSVSLSLIPGKLQKQRSTVIRKSRNPIFNEDFFFDGLTAEDLCLRSLRFKVVNKKSSMKRDYILGDCDLPLSSFVTF
ncbi:C2 calcium-dependent domain-containing protein 4A [Gadus morhua]|uniref:C2 calcium dependent domain containing 4A n=1 Tax=Gadus morhua TaxID=8049 RepID=A0A8C5BJS4_GADMO|nr:C2 calcium-dependent domain-containing protein 4C-like [Gadus morhua]